MLPSFIAFATKAGIVCAADTRHSIYQLSNNEPLAIAVNPQSPIPWDEILTGYKALNSNNLHADYQERISDFEKYLSALPTKEEWNDLDPTLTNIVLMGYDTSGLYPRIQDTFVTINNDALSFTNTDYYNISLDNKFTYNILGDFDSISTLLLGVNDRTRSFFREKYITLIETYKQRINKRFKGTKYESQISTALSDTSSEQYVDRILSEASMNSFQKLAIGFDSFSIEELVYAAESLIDANAKLNHLHDGNDGPLKRTEEIMVITRTEGVTWIKHCLFAI